MLSDKDIKLIGKLAEKLKQHGLLMCTAESCTGGLIAASCTSQPGSSAWFAGGIVSYTNDMKHRILGVPREALDNFGAVSEVVVEHMSIGALSVCNAGCSIAVSGIAGPDGGSPEKPVGTVCLAVAVPAAMPKVVLAPRHNVREIGATRVYSLTMHFPDSRREVRRQSVLFGFGMLEETLG